MDLLKARYISTLTLTIILIPGLLSSVHSAKILLLPFAWKSHVFEISNIAETLKNHGHELSLILPTSYPDLEKAKKSSIYEVVTYRTVDPDFYMLPNEELDDMIELLMDLTPIEDYRNNYHGFIEFCTNLLSDKDLYETIKAKKFDLAIVDVFPCARCNLALVYRLGIPYVTLTTTYEPWLQRIPAIPSFVPFQLGQRFTQTMTFTERLANAYYLLDWSAFPGLVYTSDEFMAPYIPDKPFKSLTTLVGEAELHLFDTDVIIDYPRPTMPNEINIGGLSTKPAKPLTGEVKDFVEAHPEGIIIVSFGSVDVLCESRLSTFLESFKRLKQGVIIRTTKDYSEIAASKPKNVLLLSWIPQNDILGHPNTKLFITHCGANGQFEALYHGVPMLGFPIFSDQPYNARRVAYHGYGLYLDLLNINPAHLTKVIKGMLANQTFYDNIRRGSEIFKSRPMKPKDRAAYWVEHILEFGGKHLRSSALDLAWYEYLMLDILAVLLGGILLASILLCVILRCLMVTFCRSGVKSKTE